jgi:hypothetical protein
MKTRNSIDDSIVSVHTFDSSHYLLLQPHSTTLRTAPLLFFFSVFLLFNFVFPFPSTTKKHLRPFCDAPHSITHTPDFKRKVTTKNIFWQCARSEYLCASCSPFQQKKRKQKVVGILWCLYNNIVVTSSVSNWKIVWSGNINLLVGEQINKIFKKIWTVLTYVKHKIKMYNTIGFHVIIARNKKFELEHIYWNHLVQRCFQLILEINETNLVWIRAFPRSK